MSGDETRPAPKDRAGNEIDTGAAPTFHEDNARDFLDMLHGDRAGHFALAFNTAGPGGRRLWSETPFAWPAERDRLLREVRQLLASGDPVDVYCCPALRLTPKRRKGDAAPPAVLWFDLDGPPKDPALLATLDPLRVASGTPGHLHGYLPLTRPVDLGLHSQLNKALAERLGADAKWSDESLLRLPGTPNHKTSPPTMVELLPGGGRVWDPDELAGLLTCTTMATTSPTSPPSGTRAPAAPEPAPDPLPVAVRRALRHAVNPNDRSGDHHRLVTACKDGGLTLGQTITVVSTYPPSVSKYADRLAAEVGRSWGNALNAEVWPAPTDPMSVARKFVQRHSVDGKPTLRRWRGNWMCWRTTHWAETELATVRAELYAELENATFHGYLGKEPKPIEALWAPNRNKIANVVEALAAVTHTDDAVDAPTWLARDGTRTQQCNAGEIVACTNGLLHVTTRELLPHDPMFFNTVSVPFDYEAAATAPTWDTFLSELWPTDSQARTALQQFTGYVLSGRTDLQKILMLIGPTRSGKGTIARILQRLIGPDNAAGPTLASLASNFGLAPLLGKSLAVVADARLSGNTHLVVERLLTISGEDTITVDRKFREPWTGKMTARFLIISNELPTFGDSSGAIAHRLLVLVMANSWLHKENTRLTGQLTAELPGILNWSLDGLDQLTTAGKFTEPKSSADAALAILDQCSPMSAFIRDCCVRGAQHEVAVDELYAAWRLWCSDNGRDRPGTVQALGKALRSVVPGARVSHPRGDAGSRCRVYVGLALDLKWTGFARVRVPTRSTTTEPDESGGGTRWNAEHSKSAPPTDTAATVPAEADHTDAACRECGQRMLLRRPGRDICERCGDTLARLSKGRTA